MTKEKFAEAKQLLEAIAGIEGHRDAIVAIIGERSDLHLESTHNNKTVKLNKNYFPIDVQDFIQLYLKRLDAKLVLRKKELDEL